MSVSTKLHMLDQMTPVLRSVVNSLNLTVSAMDDMKSSMESAFDSRAIDAAKRSIRDAEQAISQLPHGLDEVERSQRDVNREINRGNDLMHNLGTKVMGVVAAYLSFRSLARGVTSLLSSGLERAARVETTGVSFRTMLGSEDAAQQFMDELLDFAKTTPFQFPDLADASRNLVAFGMEAENVIPVMNAVGNAVAGVGGGSQELIQIADAFGAIQIAGKVTMQEINRLHSAGVPALQILANQAGVTADVMRTQISNGAIEAEMAIAMLVDGIERGTDGIAGATAAFGGMMENYGGTWVGAVDSLRGAWGRAGQAIMEQHMPALISGMGQLTQIINRIPQMFAPVSDLFGVIIESIVEGLNSIMPFIEQVVEYMGHAAQFMIENWSWIQPIIVGLGAALSALIPILVVLAAKQLIWNTIMNANPIFLIISLVVGLITWLINLWKTNDNFVAGFMRAWNSVLNFFDKIPIFFTKVGHGIANAFDNARVLSLKILESLVNGVIDGINWLIDKLNMIPGVSLNAIEKLEFSAAAEVEAEARRQAREDALSEMEDNAAKRAEEREQRVLDMLEERAAKREKEAAKREEKMSQIPEAAQFGGFVMEGLSFDSIDKVGEVGKIKDDVNVASEDLKMMRELAEMRNIQNFVTLTPQISVQTGDIRETADTEEVIASITEQLVTELESSARGVYA